MKTVAKALSLLQQFVDKPGEKPLGTIASAAGLDKATTRRMLVSLCDFGLIEQDSASRSYSLGPAILPLARAREAQRPLTSVVEPYIREISETTGETTHFGVPAQGAISVLCVSESPKPIRAHIAEGTLLPLHTSGAGIAFLSAADDALLSEVATGKLSGQTEYSYTTEDAVRKAVELARQRGYAMTEQTFEEDVCGISVPVRRGNGALAGVIGVATPSQRMNDTVRDRIARCLRRSAERLAHAL